MKEELAERKQRKKEARARGEIDERMVDDDDFDVNFSVVDFSKIDHGMGNKKFTSRFSFMTKDDKGKVDQRWDAGDVNDGGGFWKTDGPSAAEQAAAEKAEKRAAKKEARKKQKEEALAQEVEEDADLKAKKKVCPHTGLAAARAEIYVASLVPVQAMPTTPPSTLSIEFVAYRA